MILKPCKRDVDSIGVEGDIENPMPLADICAGPSGMPQQQFVEALARYLPRLGLRHLGRDREVGKPLSATVGTHECRAPLRHEAGITNQIGGPDGLDHIVDGRQQRLANMKAR